MTERTGGLGGVDTLHRARRRRTCAWRRAGERLLWCEPFAIVLLAPALLFPGRFWVAELQPLMVTLLFVFWPLRLLVGGRNLRRTPLDLPLLALVLAVGAALAVSPARASSWEAAGFLLLGVAAAAALIQWPPTQARPGAIAGLLLAAGLALAMVGPFLLGNIPDKLGLAALLPLTGSWSKTLGETINPNVLGGALLPQALLVLAVALGPRWWRQPWRWLWLALAGLLVVILALTQCRGAYLGLGVGVLLLLLLRWPASGWLLIPLAILGAALVFFSGGLMLAFDAIGGDAPSAAGATGSGLGQRLAIWQAAVAAIQQQPLTGIGMGLFGPWISQHGLLVTGAGGPPHAHNLLLQVAADLGLLGLAAYAGVWLAAVMMLVALLHARPPMGRRNASPIHPFARSPAENDRRLPIPELYRRRRHWTLAAGAAAALAAVLVHGMVDAALWGNKVAFIPWLLLAQITNLFLYSEECA